ncbi:CGNR zinc finger domain-containing protein [Amycolatopsis sp. H20-H5]|uniref:CGNR zinc finger domain-containing protein n=1 Tax=Amycolatopsis sp. H20-H5 TaxID=3046309 RepID=UPI002DBE5EBF|nr:ABATE domain-containing protein [Amycolatopsis sp. H20-H5]MEC3981460.1 ABATE domain-containing protein [Amycolatopsis sp. H20-H5]
MYGTGNVALDLVCTVGHRRTDVLEFLATPADLVRWVAGTGLVGRPVAVDAAGLAGAVRLRETVYRLGIAAIDGAGYRPADRQALNELAVREPVEVRLAEDGSVRRSGGLDAVLADVARAAVELLGGPAARTIRECDAPECTRLYVDNSRRGSRRWCDMSSCGNRAKAALFRARHTAPDLADCP